MTQLETKSKQEKSNVADVSNDFSRSVSESIDLVDATGRRVNEAAQRGASESIDRAEATGRKLNQAVQRGASETIERTEATRQKLSQAAEEMFNDALRAYQALFSFRGVRRIAETYIDINERMARESFEFNRRLMELWFDGARKSWQAAEEERSAVKNSA